MWWLVENENEWNGMIAEAVHEQYACEHCVPIKKLTKGKHKIIA